MAFGESYVQRQARLDRQRTQFPELGNSDYDTIGKVDALRRAEGRPLTSFGQAVEDTYVGIQQEQTGYDPNTPDAAPNVLPWRPSVDQRDPYGIRAPYQSPDQSYYGASSSPGETLRNLGNAFGEVAKPLVGWGNLDPALRAPELGGTYTGSPESRQAADQAMRTQLIEAAMQSGVPSGLKVLGGPIDRALNPADVRGAAPEAFQRGRGNLDTAGNLRAAAVRPEDFTPRQTGVSPRPQSSFAQGELGNWQRGAASLPEPQPGMVRLYRGQNRSAVLGMRALTPTGVNGETVPPGRFFTPDIDKAFGYATKEAGQAGGALEGSSISYVDVPASTLERYRYNPSDRTLDAAEYILPEDLIGQKRTLPWLTVDDYAKATRPRPASAPPRFPFGGLSGADDTAPTLPSAGGGGSRPPTAVGAAASEPANALDALMESIKAAKPLQAQNAEKLSQFRSRQAGAFSGAVGEGEAGFRRGLSSMRGQAERVGFEPLRQVVGQQGVDELFTRLNGAGLRPFEHASAGSALANIMDGVVPVPSELAQLEKAFPGLTRALQDAKIVAGPGVTDYLRDLAAVPQSIKSAFDLSGFRQTATAAYAHPKMAATAFKKSLEAAKSEAGFQTIQNDLANRWYAPIRNEAGVALATSERGLAKGEGTLISDIVNKIPGYRPSQRAYATMLNLMRDGLFQHMLEGYGGAADSIPADELRRWGRLVNVSTGRGDLRGMIGESVTDSKLFGTPIFWAPRLLMSRVQMPMEMLSSSPQVRKEAARQLVAFVGVNSTLLGAGAAAGMWSVERDPRSADFGQIRIGNQRIDPWAGYRPMANFIARLTSGEVKSTTSGELYSKDRRQVVLDFLRSKFSPLTATATNLMTGKNAIGEPVTPESVAADLIVPLFIRDLYEAARIDGPGAAARAGLSGLGVGVNTYESTPASRPSRFPRVPRPNLPRVPRPAGAR